MIKKFRHRDDFVLPDRSAVTMTVPFMRAYTELLVKTCHRRGAFAMGGMAAFIPNRRDPEVTENALAKVHEDKSREAGDGFDGTWVAHPDLVPTAMEEFDAVLGDRPNQIERQRPEVSVTAEQLLAVPDTPGEITEAGIRQNVSVGIQLPRRLAERHRRRRDRQPDGGRRHRRDLPLADLAVDRTTAAPTESACWRSPRGGRRRAGPAASRRGDEDLRAGRARRRLRRVPDAPRVRAPP